MNRPALGEKDLLVIDEVLPEKMFRSLLSEVARGEYRSVHAQKWDKAWRLWDGNPQRGPSIYFDPSHLFHGKCGTYPTNTTVDALVDVLRKVSFDCPDVVGKEGRDWVALYLSPWLYPVGSALSLHQDSDRYSGSFTYFTHSRWQVDWGGELIVSRTLAGAEPPHFPYHSDPDDRWISDDGSQKDSGIATCICPKPNRLVLIGPNRPHRISRVDQNAGARVRASIAGFFLRGA